MASDTLAVSTIRALCADAVQSARSGHPGAPMGLAPLGWTLFSKLRKHSPRHPEWFDRDRFVLSCGHASMLQYSLLYLCGYDVSLQDLRDFRQWGSRTPGHPEYRHTPGVETTTGPLGQGFANAVGMAMAEEHLARRFNQAGEMLVDHKTWVIASDGDLMEGVCAEAASLAGHLRLGKLIVFWDDNRITIDGSTDLSFSEDVCARFRAYGWETLEVEDGESVADIERAGQQAASNLEQPSLVRVRTVIGYPAPSKQGSSAAHGAPLGEDEVAATKKALDFPQEAFYVPPSLLDVRESIAQNGESRQAQWAKTLDSARKADPSLVREFERVVRGELPDNWQDGLPTFDADTKGQATRKSSGDVIQSLASKLPELVGGSADLAGSNNSYQKGLPDFEPRRGTEPARNVHWGVREHAMGAACNGMALHGGVLPYAATFLIFSDYMKPSMRLAALMKLPVRYVLTHDSIGLGEDGPTHQPVEQLASLRSIPGFAVFRPADANETREAWKAMLALPGPAAIVLSRQALPILDRTSLGDAGGVARGGYVLSREPKETVDVVLIATGSEVSLAIDAQAKLVAKGLSARVVSLPSWEAFEAQDQAYRDSVIPPACEARVAVEAGSRFGWERWVGRRGGFVTVDTFGASAPATELFERYGITSSRVVETAERLLKSRT